MVSQSPSIPARPTRSAGKLAWVSSTYFGEGLPWSVLHQMATEFLTAVRAPLWQVGYTSWLHGAVSLKFLWSPLIDLFGAKRSWMVILQIVMGLGMVGVGAVAAQGELVPFWIALVLLSVFHATHDIACDGYYMLALDKSDQALFAGVRVAAFRVAMLVGSSGLVILAGNTSWFWGFGAAGAIMIAVGVGNALFLPRIEKIKLTKPEMSDAPRARRGAYLDAYRSFFAQPDAVKVLAFIFSFKLGETLTFAMTKPLLRDIGISTEWRGVLSTPSTISHIVGAVVGGGLISRLGLKRCLIPMTFIMAIPLYAPVAWFQPGFNVILIVSIVEQFAGGMGSTVLVVFLMQRCRKSVSASHYAFASAIVALGGMLIGALSGHLNSHFGHRYYFLLCFLFSIPGLILSLMVPREPLDSDVSAIQAK
ncbi:MAG: MFS transporter [Deltaproteobacteria bacterium]|nr:MFS transporter [Deltaproteobacteria bacterium]